MQKGLIRRLLKLFPSRWCLVTGLMVTIMFSMISVAFSYLIREIIDAAVERQREIFLLLMQISVTMILLNFIMAYFRTRIMKRCLICSKCDTHHQRKYTDYFY